MSNSISSKVDILKQKLFSDIIEIPEALKPSYFPGLDGLRAIAIIMVLLGHALMGTPYVNYLPGGIGVEVFFAISGFLITTLLLKEKIKNGKVSLPKFYIRRALRIFPVAYLYLICLLILNYAFNLNVTPRMFLTAGLYLGNFPIQYGNNWQTAHFWSLAVEEQFYFLFPFIIVKSTRKYLLIAALILFLIPFITMMGKSRFEMFDSHFIYKIILFFYYLLGTGMSSVLIGSVTSVLMFKGIIVVSRKRKYFLSFVIFVSAIGLHVTGVLNLQVISVVFPVLISYVIVLNLKGENFFSLILNLPVLVKIGVFSYSIYIWQQLFTANQPWKNLFKYSDSPLLNTVSLAVVAYISFTFFETKFLKLKNNFKST